MGVCRLGKAPMPRSQRPGAMSDDANRRALAEWARRRSRRAVNLEQVRGFTETPPAQGRTTCPSLAARKGEKVGLSAP